MAKRGRFVATAYGPPWNAMEGGPKTATGMALPGLGAAPKYVVAVDPRVIPYHSKVKIWPNPFGDPNIVFSAEDTGGAIKGDRIDFFDNRGRAKQNQWGRRGVNVEVVGQGGPVQQGAAAAQTIARQPQQVTALTPEIAARRAAILESLISRRHPQSPLVQLGVISKALGGQVAASPGSAAQPAMGTRPATKHPELDQGGTAVFEGTRVAASVKPILEYARQKGWRGKVVSGWRSRAKQQYLYTHPQGYPVAKPGTSMHEKDAPGWGAVDVENAEQLARILAKSPYRDKFKWAGAKDRVHFSFVHGGAW